MVPEEGATDGAGEGTEASDEVGAVAGAKRVLVQHQVSQTHSTARGRQPPGALP